MMDWIKVEKVIEKPQVRKGPSRLQDESTGQDDSWHLGHGGTCPEPSSCVLGASPSQDQTPLQAQDNFDNLLEELRTLHEKKRADYASNQDRFSNFRIAAEFSGMQTYQSIENLIGVKQARLLELRGTGKTPKNESVRDTLVDRAVYCILAVMLHDEEKKNPQ